MIVGYARASTDNQVAGLESQERLLKEVGCERVFMVRIPTEVSQGYRFDVGHRSDLIPATWRVNRTASARSDALRKPSASYNHWLTLNYVTDEVNKDACVQEVIGIGPPEGSYRIDRH